MFCVLMLVIVFSRCKNDSSLVISPKSVDFNITNGRAYDKAFMKASKYESIIVPKNTKVLTNKKVNDIEIYIEKTLYFVGHPGKPIRIGEVRKYMGVAYKTDGEILTIAAYGEWNSRIEGGAFINLLIVVPKRIRITKKSDLRVEKSVQYFINPKLKLDKKWKKVSTEPDYDFSRRFKQE